MNIIKLTASMNDAAFYVVAENILCFFDSVGGAKVFGVGGSEQWSVNETAEEIIALIAAAKGDAK
jgi:ABC-type anion transport system duplicated permease subunit